MTEVAVVLCCMLAGVGALLAPFGFLFLSLMFRSATPATGDDLPKVGILLPLRGADPELADGLRRLMQQDYPNFELQIVIDSPEDSSWGVVDQAMAKIDAPHVHVSNIDRRSATCSPQCTALIQAVERLSEDCEVVVTVDGDVVAHPTWLRELVAPLLDERVGVAHGNRWFMPRDSSWGSLVRYAWNAAAIIPMYLLRIPWAGTFAIRKRVLLESGLFDKWPQTIVPDAPSRDLLAKMGLSVRFVPSLMMVNRERCDLAFSLDFLKRQMTWTRIYHSRWFIVVLHALLTTGLLLAAAGLAIAGLVQNQWDTVAWAVGGLAGYISGLLVMLLLLEYGVRRVVAARGESTAWMSPIKLLKLPLVIPLAVIVHFAAVMLASLRQRVEWRGVTYQVNGPYDIQIVGERPFDESAQPVEQNVSL